MNRPIDAKGRSVSLTPTYSPGPAGQPPAPHPKEAAKKAGPFSDAMLGPAPVASKPPPKEDGDDKDD